MAKGKYVPAAHLASVLAPGAGFAGPSIVATGLPRTYRARTFGDVTQEQLEDLIEGVEIDGQRCGFKSIDDGGGEGANHWYRVSLFEGRNREVRRMFEAVGCTVSRLIRLRYGPFTLPPQLKRGKCRELEEDEVKRLMKAIAAGPSRLPDQKMHRHWVTKGALE